MRYLVDWSWLERKESSSLTWLLRWLWHWCAATSNQIGPGTAWNEVCCRAGVKEGLGGRTTCRVRGREHAGATQRRQLGKAGLGRREKISEPCHRLTGIAGVTACPISTPQPSLQSFADVWSIAHFAAHVPCQSLTPKSPHRGSPFPISLLFITLKT